MSNTQARMFSLHDAIERDRMANSPELKVVRKVVHEPMEQAHEPTHSQPWEALLTIGIGVAIMMIAAFS
jgi:hypothetical protein